MVKSPRLIAPAVLGLLVLCDPASALDKSPWQTACDAAKRCQMTSSQSLDGREVTRILIYKVADKTLLEYLVPLRVNLQRGVALKIKEKLYATQALYCDSPGCVGFAVIDKSLLNEMKNGASLKLVFSPHGSKEYFSYDYSLTGFTQAYGEFIEAK